MSALEPISMQAVSEKVVLARKGRLEEDAQFVVNPRLTSTEFIPLEERMAGEKPEIAACLAKLKEKVGSEIQRAAEHQPFGQKPADRYRQRTAAHPVAERTSERYHGRVFRG